jgi:hypothetical protein
MSVVQEGITRQIREMLQILGRTWESLWTMVVGKEIPVGRGSLRASYLPACAMYGLSVAPTPSLANLSDSFIKYIKSGGARWK